MPLKYLVREFRGIREGLDCKSRRQVERNCGINGRGRSYVAPESTPMSPPVAGAPQQSRWANLPQELLLDIIRSLEESETVWPGRRDVVSCAAVCRSWRATTKEVIRTPEQCGLLTFPMSLKQPGPRDSPIQCFIKRERATSTYRLYLGLSPALAGDAGKLLLTAKKIRRATNTEFVISLVADDFSRTSVSYVGKLRSNFLGTKFVVYDSQPPCESSTVPSARTYQKVNLKKVSPNVPVSSHKVATVSYELNVLRTRGPRRMHCTTHFIPFASIQEGGTAPTPSTFGNHIEHELSVWQEKEQDISSISPFKPLESIHSTVHHPLVLKNKAPRWHEQLQCWCLNFKGRVTVASVKNFQLVAAVNSSQDIPSVEQEKVILQFGKIGKDIFTMDYRYPLSAFQAFATCLSSFDTKPACE